MMCNGVLFLSVSDKDWFRLVRIQQRRRCGSCLIRRQQHSSCLSSSQSPPVGRPTMSHHVGVQQQPPFEQQHPHTARPAPPRPSPEQRLRILAGTVTLHYSQVGNWANKEPSSVRRYRSPHRPAICPDLVSPPSPPCPGVSLLSGSLPTRRAIEDRVRAERSVSRDYMSPLQIQRVCVRPGRQQEIPATRLASLRIIAISRDN